MSKKVYSRPELSAYGEFANLTQQSGTGFGDFQANISADGTVSVTNTTPGTNPNTTTFTTPDQSFTVVPSSL
ncbi:MAG: hypothetical protein KI793_10825 [Rivularia sp. (in: Bacteria)]|nr:hypothetical protein [Rivularia sp. MS3]